MHLMDMWGEETRERWPIGVIWFATFLVPIPRDVLWDEKNIPVIDQRFLQYIHAAGDKLSIYTKENLPSAQIDILMALAFVASYKAADTCRVAKCAAEDAWLLSGNSGPIVDAVLWKRMYRGIQIYKGRTYAEKSAVLPSLVRKRYST